MGLADSFMGEVTLPLSRPGEALRVTTLPGPLVGELSGEAMEAMLFFGSRRGDRKSSNGGLLSVTGETLLFTGVLTRPASPLREALLFESLDTEEMLFLASIIGGVLVGLVMDEMPFPAEALTGLPLVREKPFLASGAEEV